MIDPFEPPPHAHRVEWADGKALIWEARPGIMVHRVGGVLSLPLVRCLEDFYTPILRPEARVRIFSDARSVTHVTREAREQGTAFMRERLPALEALHVLIASQFVALAYGIFRQEIGEDRVFIYSDRESLRLSFSEALNATENGRGDEAPP
jgi:hypothetical protein